jgi:hypothetical protein
MTIEELLAPPPGSRLLTHGLDMLQAMHAEALVGIEVMS